MARTVADTIRELTSIHLEQQGGLLFGQCITAVGWIQNTVPPHARGLVELPMCDVSGPGFAIGAALMGRRSVFVLRFQSFLWLASSLLVNYCAKAKELWDNDVPLLIRAIGMEGHSIGPVSTNCFHSPYMHMPGLPVAAPMTPTECEQVWHWWMNQSGPLLVSEHRGSYSNTEELECELRAQPDITLFGISASRFHLEEASQILARESIHCNIYHIVWLKPFKVDPLMEQMMKLSKLGLVIDSAYEMCGAAEHIAMQLMKETGCRVEALGMEDRSCGIVDRNRNGTPTVERIVAKVKEMVA